MTANFLNTAGVLINGRKIQRSLVIKKMKKDTVQVWAPVAMSATYGVAKKATAIAVRVTDKFWWNNYRVSLLFIIIYNHKYILL